MDTWIALALANLVASAAPGQNVALVGSATARSGLPGGGCAIGGILLAEAVWSGVALALALGARKMGPNIFAALELGSGIVLLAFAVHTLRPLGLTAHGGPPRTGPARLTAEGFWIGLANPLALIFFVSLFPAFVSTTGPAPGPSQVGFYVSAIVLSSAAALAPYPVGSRLLARAGPSRVHGLVSGLSLLVLGAGILARALA